jgi:hypothetical protein
MSNPTHPQPVVPLDYSKPSTYPWRLIRITFGIFLLATGIDMIFAGIVFLLTGGRLSWSWGVYLACGVVSSPLGTAFL